MPRLAGLSKREADQRSEVDGLLADYGRHGQCGGHSVGPTCEDRSYPKERAARMYNPELDLTLFVNPNAGERRYVLRECSDHGLIDSYASNRKQKYFNNFRMVLTVKTSG